MRAAALSPRERIAHLHRRLGFGAALEDVERGEREGIEAELRRLLSWEQIPDSTDAIHPFEFAFKPKEEAEPGAYRFRLWWLLGMVSGSRPLQEKLALFWHSHFAASDAKVEHGPAMLDYLLTLRREAGGTFPKLLRAMAKDPAVLRNLDLDRAVKSRPNENFAREVMELYTLGQGRGYEESDVKEVARALTGIGVTDMFYDSGKTNDERLLSLLKDGRPGLAYAEFPALRDAEPKTILGRQKDWRADEVLDTLANHPLTAERIVGKLWAFFAFADPEPKDLGPVIAVFRRTGGGIRETLEAIVRHPAFWSERCVRNLVGSPADLVIGTARKLRLGPIYLSMRAPDAKPTTPIPQPLLDELGYLAYLMERQGLNILYPPDVSGWKPDRAWATSAAMAERMRFGGVMMWKDDRPQAGVTRLQDLLRARAPGDEAEAAKFVLDALDAPPAPAIAAALTGLLKERTLKKAFAEPRVFAEVLYTAIRLLQASPAHQLI